MKKNVRVPFPGKLLYLLLPKSFLKMFKPLALSLMFVGFLLPTTTIHAQVIDEGFEGAVWPPTGATTSTGTGGTSTVTNSTGTGAWTFSCLTLYNSAAAVTTNTSNSPNNTVNTLVHSGRKSISFAASSNSFICTPVITNGVATISVWVRPEPNPGGSFPGVAKFIVAVASASASTLDPAVLQQHVNVTTNTTAANQNPVTSVYAGASITWSQSLYSATAVQTSLNTSYNNNLTYTFSSGTPSSSFPATATNASNQNQIGPNLGNFETGRWNNLTITLTGSLSNAASYVVKFQRVSYGGAKIDDIVITNTTPQVYQSNASGPWEDPNTWQISTDNGQTFTTAATTVPTLNDGLVTIQNGHAVTVNSSRVIDQTVVCPTCAVAVASGAALTVLSNGLTFQSDATGTGRIGTTAGAITGSVNVERFIPLGKRAYRNLAPGVNTTGSIYANWQNSGDTLTPGVGTHITGVAGKTRGTDPATGLNSTMLGAPSLFTYAPGAASFTAVTRTNAFTDTLSAYKGYHVFIRGDRKADLSTPNNSGAGTPNIAMNNLTRLRATGRPVVGSVVYSSTATGPIATPALTTVIDSFSLIPNPYWSPVDFDQLTKAGLNSTYWIFDPNIGDRGAYTSYTTGAGSSGGGAINQFIQPGQAVFVQTSGATPSITFTEASKASTFSGTFRLANQTPSRLVVALTKYGIVQDAATAAFRDDFSAAVGNEDAMKFANPDENIAIVNSNKVLGVEGRATVTQSDVVPLRLWNLYSNGNYALTINGADFDAGVFAYVEDKYINKQYPVSLDGTTVIPFSFNESESASYYDRFSVVFKAASVLPVTLTSVKASQKNAGIQVEWSTASESNIKAYEVERSADGRQFSKSATVVATGNNSNAVNYDWFDANANNGVYYYRIKVIGNNGESKYSAIVRVSINGGKSDIIVLNNPVRSKVLTIEFRSLIKGKYELKLLNSIGQAVYSKTLDHQGGSAAQSIQLQSKLSAGVYVLQLKGSETVINKNIVVE